MSLLNNQKGLILGVGVFCLASAASVFAGEAHEHGVGQLDIVLEGNTLQAMLTTPAANVVGFEHAPETDSEKKALADAIAALNNVESVFAIPSSANCTLSSLDVDAGGLADMDHEGHEHDEHEHDHDEHEKHADHDHDEHEHSEKEAHADHDDHDHDHEGHTDMGVTYAWQCEAPEALAALEMTIFKNFPAFEEVRVQLVDASQRALTLTPSNAGLGLTP